MGTIIAIGAGIAVLAGIRSGIGIGIATSKSNRSDCKTARSER